MKKNAFLLPLLALAVALVGCKPTPEKNSDTGSDDVAGSAGKSLVKKMVVTAAYTDTAYDEEYDGSATLNFAYEEGRLASITGTGEYVYRYMDYSEPDPVNPEGNAKAEESVWMEDKTSGTATVGFTYDGEKVNVSLSMDATYDEAGYGPEHYSGTGTMALQMNADKAVSSARSKFVSEEESSDEWLVNFEYADNSLTRVAVPYEGMDASYGLEFGWENGNIVRVGSYDEYVKGSKKSPAQNRMSGKTDLGTAMTRLMFPLCGILSSSDRGHGSTKKSVDWYADYHMEYTSHENKSNVDIASLAWTILGGIVDPSQFVGVFGFTGTMSKNLPESLYEDDEYEPDGRWDYGRVEYVLDADGLMEKVTVFDEEGNQVGTISFEY